MILIVVNKYMDLDFSAHKPARSCVQVAKLPKDVSVEIGSNCPS